MEKILIIDDDENICLSLADDLILEGYQVVSENDGLKGFQTLREGNFDLLILDLVLPSLSGLELLLRIRSENIKLPVIILSALKDYSDIRNGLKNGADEYVAKPFRRKDILARIARVFERKKLLCQQHEVFQFGSTEINFNQMYVCVKGKKVFLTFIDTHLLLDFIRKKNLIRTKQEIIEAIWDKQVFIPQWIFDLHIELLRKKIEENPQVPQILINVAGSGYQFRCDS